MTNFFDLLLICKHLNKIHANPLKYKAKILMTVTYESKITTDIHVIESKFQH